MLLYEVADALDAAHVPFAFVGGYAVALHGAVRGTVDVDLILQLSKKHYAAAETALKGLSLQPLLPVTAAEVFEFREEYIKNRNMRAWNFRDPSDPTRAVDIIITHDLAKLRRKLIRSGERTLPVLALDDLIAMKKAAGRPQDLVDVQALEKLRK